MTSHENLLFLAAALGFIAVVVACVVGALSCLISFIKERKKGSPL